MVSAGEYLAGMTGELTAFISLNDATRENIERPFIEARKKLSDGDLTKEAMISGIVTVEFSEWNDILLYVVNTLRDRSLEFQRLAAKIQRHKEEIEAFLKSLPDGEQYLQKVRRLPSVWLHRILIVEDEVAILQLLSTILEREGIVDTARDGYEGLGKISQEYFDVIVSDLDMPIVSGMEFYEQAAKKDASIGKRFLFFTGYPTSENINFFQKCNLRYVTKPANIEEIRNAVRDLIRGT
jgi:CheY-like chemotaxis protein